LQNNLELIIFPFTKWSYSKGNEMFFGFQKHFQKVDSDYNVRK